VVDNDEGEELLLQKIAEESENAQKSQESSGNEPEDSQGSSSRKF
jgi:hypothetical protein